MAQFTRLALYTLVWEQPRSQLKAKVGVSDVAIAKACRKHGIPMPDRGYWAQKAAGKPVKQPSLPPRRPGMHDWVEVGQKGHHAPPAEPLVEPIFDETIDEMRVSLLQEIGTVPYPRLDTGMHWLTRKLLTKDSERRAQDRLWNTPVFDSPLEKRKLRLMNAVFLAVQKAGYEPSASLSSYDRSLDKFQVTVGYSHLHLAWQLVVPRRLGKPKPDSSPLLTLKLQHYYDDNKPIQSWQDAEGRPLESQLGDIVVDTILQGEIHYRDACLRHYAWQKDEIVRKERERRERRERREAEERQRREAEAQRRQELLQGLLDDAAALDRANTIRQFVETILAQRSRLPAPAERLDRWATWALGQADTIDPARTLGFLTRLGGDADLGN